MNLVKLYCRTTPMWIDTAQLNSPRTHLTIRNSRGDKMSDVARTRQKREDASYGVHRDNLFASPKLAKIASEKIWKEIFG